MNMKKYREAMVNLEQLHWHLHLNGGPDMWTRELLRRFEAAVNDNINDEIVVFPAEPPQPAA
jgi:hypothetical protein